MSETRKEEMSRRVIRNEPGITEIHLESREVLRDGPMRVECWWSEEDTAYIAQLTDDEQDGRPFTATHTGIGATREEALAHLAVAEYVTAIAVAEPPATPPAAETGRDDFAFADGWDAAIQRAIDIGLIKKPLPNPVEPFCPPEIPQRFVLAGMTAADAYRKRAETP